MSKPADWAMRLVRARSVGAEGAGNGRVELVALCAHAGTGKRDRRLVAAMSAREARELAARLCELADACYVGRSDVRQVCQGAAADGGDDAELDGTEVRR